MNRRPRERHARLPLLLLALAVVAAGVAPAALAAQVGSRPAGVPPPRDVDFAVEAPPTTPVVAPGERVEVPLRVVAEDPRNATFQVGVRSGHPGWTAYVREAEVRLENASSGEATLVVRAPREFVNEGEVYVFAVQAVNDTGRPSGVTNVPVMVRPSASQLFWYFALPAVLGVATAGGGFALRRRGRPTVGGLAVMAGAMVAVAMGSALLALVLL